MKLPLAKPMPDQASCSHILPRFKGKLADILELNYKPEDKRKSTAYNFERGITNALNEIRRRQFHNWRLVTSDSNWSGRPILTRIHAPFMFIHKDEDGHPIQVEIILDNYEFADMFKPEFSRAYHYLEEPFPKLPFADEKFFDDIFQAMLVSALQLAMLKIVTQKMGSWKIKFVARDETSIHRLRALTTHKIEQFNSFGVFMRRGYVRNIILTTKSVDSWFDSMPINNRDWSLDGTTSDVIQQLKAANLELDRVAKEKYDNRFTRTEKP